MSGGDAPDLGEVLFEHPKGRGMTFRFSIRSYKGRRFLDAREWGERDGKPMATGKGATFPLDGLEPFTAALIAHRHGAGGQATDAL